MEKDTTEKSGHLDMPTVIEGFQNDLRKASEERHELANELEKANRYNRSLDNKVSELQESLDSTLDILQKMIDERKNN